MSVFHSPEFRDWAESFRRGYYAAQNAPSVPCPACGQGMVAEIGAGRVSAYRCWDHECVGFRVAVEDLCDGETFRVLMDDVLRRKSARDEMLRRNHAHKSPRVPGEYWCAECHGYHTPTAEHPLCSFDIGFLHAPMPPDIHFNFKGWRFTPPFHCMCCGKEVCFRQWAFGRSCGTCDTGACQKKSMHAKRDGVFYGNGEMIDPVEAEEYRFTPDRMLKVPEVKPAGVVSAS